MRSNRVLKVAVAVAGATLFAGSSSAMAADGVQGKGNGKQTITGQNCGIKISQFGQIQDINTTNSVLTIRANGNRRLECIAQLPDGQPVNPFKAKGFQCGTGDGTMTLTSRTVVKPNGKVTLVCRYKAPGNAAESDEPDDV